MNGALQPREHKRIVGVCKRTRFNEDFLEPRTVAKKVVERNQEYEEVQKESDNPPERSAQILDEPGDNIFHMLVYGGRQFCTREREVWRVPRERIICVSECSIQIRLPGAVCERDIETLGIGRYLAGDKHKRYEDAHHRNYHRYECREPGRTAHPAQNKPVERLKQHSEYSRQC